MKRNQTKPELELYILWALPWQARAFSRRDRVPLSSAYDAFSDCTYRLDYDLTGGWGYDLRKVEQAPGGASVGGSICYAMQSSAQR